MERILIGFLIWYITLDFKLIPLIQFCIRHYPKSQEDLCNLLLIYFFMSKKKKNEESTLQ